MHDDDNIRANHDQDHDWVAREEELERWLGRVFMLFAALGCWKLLDLACGGLGAFAGFIGWLLTILA
jgi:hypothetical protein